MRSHKRPQARRRHGNKYCHVSPSEALEIARKYDETGCTIKELAAATGRSFIAVAEAVLLSERHKRRLYG